jgi:poly-gamma-glutamate synthesis protein (capsule biosynthesis protein)
MTKNNRPQKNISGLQILKLILLFILLSACTPVAANATPYPTFTPLSGFRILGSDPSTPTPSEQATETSTPTILPTTAPTSTEAPPTEALVSPSEEAESSPTAVIEDDPIITMVFTGQIVPARCVQAESERLGQADYIYDNVRDILSSSNLTVGTLNAAIVDFGLTTGCLETFLFVGRSVHAEAMANTGFDVMSVASNHIKDCYLNNCEDQAFVATLDNLQKFDILPVGGGLNLAEAQAPKYIEISGINFAFVSLGQLPPPSFGDENSPGIGLLNEENVRKTISEADQNADFVIFLPHWGPESSHYPSASQVRLAKAAVEAGADLIIGNHTQYIQAYIELDNVPVYFGLGNLVFDQIADPKKTQSLIVRVTFEGDEIIASEEIPAINNATGAVRIADPQEFVRILTEIQNINSIVQLDNP